MSVCKYEPCREQEKVGNSQCTNTNLTMTQLDTNFVYSTKCWWSCFSTFPLKCAAFIWIHVSSVVTCDMNTVRYYMHSYLSELVSGSFRRFSICSWGSLNLFVQAKFKIWNVFRLVRSYLFAIDMRLSITFLGSYF